MMSMCVPANGFTVSFHSAVVPPPMAASLYPLPSALMVHLPNINLDSVVHLPRHLSDCVLSPGIAGKGVHARFDHAGENSGTRAIDDLRSCCASPRRLEHDVAPNFRRY